MKHITFHVFDDEYNTDVELSQKFDSDCTWMKMVNLFNDFIRAQGYHPKKLEEFVEEVYE